MSCANVRLPLILACCLLPPAASAAEKSVKHYPAFGVLTAPSETSVRVKAARYLQEAGKYDRNRFEELWGDTSRALVDRLADCLALADPQVAAALAEVRNRNSLPPAELPYFLIESQQPLFFRANIGLAYARALTSRRIYEEGLDILRLFRPEQTVDPGCYLFHRAVCEHGLMLKQEAEESITRLLDDVPSAPERYRMVATLMHFDMFTWKQQSVSDKLASIGRKMENVGRRLDLARGGQKTQKQQKEIVRRLDELIKEMENASNDSSSNSGNCPSGGQQPGNGSSQGPTPMQESVGGQDSGPGEVDAQRIREAAEQWGRLPPREREALMRSLTAKLSPRYAEVVREYFRKLSERRSGEKASGER